MRTSKLFSTFLLLLIISVVKLKGQDHSGDRDLFFIKDQVSIVLGPLFMKGKVTGDPTLPGYFTKPSPGFKAGVLYDFNFGPRFGFETGFTAGMMTTGLGNRVPAAHPYASWDGLYNLDDWAFMEIPFRLFFRQRISNHLLLDFSAGFNITRFSSSGTAIQYFDSTNSLISYVDYDLSPDYELYGFTQLSTGIFIQLRNEDFLRFAIRYNRNIDQSNIAYGRYWYFDKAITISEGRYSVTGNSIHFEFGYVFSRVKELKRQLQKQGISIPE